jgi:hypothetical protein
MKFRKKPVVIDAFKLGYDSEPEWFINELGESISFISSDGEPYLIIQTLEGKMTAHKGDYIIKGVKGELYPCKTDIFEQTYDKVKEGD